MTVESGGRVSNAWVIYPQVGDNSGKPVLIPNVVLRCISGQLKAGILRNLPLGEEPAYDQLAGEVTAHQGYDR